MLVHRNTTRTGASGFSPGTAATRNRVLREALGEQWRYQAGSDGAFSYATNGATSADRFVFMHGGFGVAVEDMRFLIHALETGDDGRVNTHVVVRTLSTLSVKGAAALAVETIDEEAAGRPVCSLGVSAGGAINRAVGGLYPELVKHQVDINSVGNAVHWGGNLWREISDAAVALGEGDDIEQRIASGLDHIWRDPAGVTVQQLNRVLGPAMREVNGFVRGVEFTMSSVRGGNVYDTLSRAIPRLISFYGADWVHARCMQRFCSEIDVRSEMRTIGERHAQGLVAPATLPIRGDRDTVCQRRMLTEAQQLMGSATAIEMAGISHEVSLAQRAVRDLVRIARDATLQLATGADEGAVYERVLAAGRENMPLRSLRQPWGPSVPKSHLGLVRGLAPISALA